MSGAGSIKMRRSRGGVNIRVTGQLAHKLATDLAAKTWKLMISRQVRVRFRDDGQDVLEWDIATDGTVTACRPYHADLYVGARVQRVPVPGDLIAFNLPGDEELRTLRWPIDAVEVRP